MKLGSRKLAADGRKVVTYRKDERPRETLAGGDVRLLKTEALDADLPPASGPLVRGRALVFNTPFPRYDYTMQVAAGSLDRYLRQNGGTMGRLDVLYNHVADSVPYASTEDGTLRTWVDAEALHYEFALDLSLERHRELHAALAAGRLDRSSAAFFVMKETWDEAADPPVRTLTELDFTGGEVSVVRIPANPAADAALVPSADKTSAEEPEETFTGGTEELAVLEDARTITIRVKLEGETEAEEALIAALNAEGVGGGLDFGTGRLDTSAEHARMRILEAELTSPSADGTASTFPTGTEDNRTSNEGKEEER